MVTRTVPALTPVCSSNISALGYDADSSTLAVQFETGETVLYDDVPVFIYTNLLNAASVGRAFYAHVRARYKAERIEGVPRAIDGACTACGAHGLALTVCLECERGTYQVQL